MPITDAIRPHHYPAQPGDQERVDAARQHVHTTRCYLGDRRPFPCPSCPTATGTLLALRVLDQRPRDAAGARQVLHDVVCVSGCGPDSDHPQRTQTDTVRALRKWHAAEATDA